MSRLRVEPALTRPPNVHAPAGPTGDRCGYPGGGPGTGGRMAELATLWIVRHGESTANVAATQAEAAGAELIDLTHRDADVPLSPTGEEQARATGRWLAGLPEARRPDVAVVSPSLRAVRTAELALAGTGVPASRDERLRDRELGILDGLTGHGVRQRHPDEAARRARLGKFY